MQLSYGGLVCRLAGIETAAGRLPVLSPVDGVAEVEQQEPPVLIEDEDADPLGCQCRGGPRSIQVGSPGWYEVFSGMAGAPGDEGRIGADGRPGQRQKEGLLT